MAHTVASNEKQPENAHHADNAAEDELMQLARASQERIRAAEAAKANHAGEAVKASLAQSEAQEARARATSEQRAAKERQRQQVASAEKAKAPVAKEPATSTHKVGSGDTLYSIAKRYNMDVAELAALNKIKGNNIKTGQTLKVAGSAHASKPQLVKAVAKGKAETKAHDNRESDSRHKNIKPDNKKDSKNDNKQSAHKPEVAKKDKAKNEKPAAKTQRKK